MTSLSITRHSDTESTYPPFEAMLSYHKIHIITEQMAGFGDVICLKKFLHLIHMFGINYANILLTTINYSEKGFSLLNKDERIDHTNIDFTFPEMPDFRLALEPDRIKNVTCTFIIPGIDPRAEKNIYDHFIAIHALTNKVWKIIYIKEYGYDSDGAIYTSYPVTNLSMGLSKRRGEIGIMISKDLVAYSERPESSYSEERLKLLDGLPVALSTLILNGLAIGEFDRQERLYYGYTFSMKSALAFAASVAEFDGLKKEPKKNITIFFPKEIGDLDLLANQHMIDICLKPYLKEFDIGKLIIKSLTGHHSTHILNDSLTKTMTLIFEPTSHENCIIFLQSSEKEVAVTGDQSLSEAISANKTFIYGLCRHKTNLAMAMISLYKESASLDTCLTFEEQLDIGDYEGLIKSMSIHFIENLKTPHLFSRFNSRITTEYDFVRPLRTCLTSLIG